MRLWVAEVLEKPKLEDCLTTKICLAKRAALKSPNRALATFWVQYRVSAIFDLFPSSTRK